MYFYYNILIINITMNLFSPQDTGIRVTKHYYPDSCSDLEAITKWILTKSRYKAAIISQGGNILWHIKIKWLRTFFSYWNTNGLEKWKIYWVQERVSEYLGNPELKISFSEKNLCLLNIDWIPLHLKEWGFIDEDDYELRPPFYNANITDNSERQAFTENPLFYRSNFEDDLELFLDELDTKTLPCLKLPKSIFESRWLIWRILDTDMK